MIDAHCHLEQKDYNPDRDEVILNCKKELKAIVTCCAHPRDFKKSLEIIKKYKNFVFLTAGFHPEYISEIPENEIGNYLEELRENKKYLVGIGECGLDYHWVKELEWREKQKELFVKHINLAKELNLPLVIHSRDAEKECLEILKEQKAKRVLLHYFSDKDLIPEVIEANYFVSVNTSVFRSKTTKKIIKRMPIEKLMTETDAPWLGFGKRNTPLSVRMVAEKIAEIKDLSFEEVDKITTENAVKFFDLGKSII
ncbi:MAG: TatD family hydrolase [Candidatus Aenigmarchaeota archaeon]|nr:TatD family hydrolase [Candidatus Aenigmarchaeota archaeon]